MKSRYLAITLVLAGVSTFAAAQSSSNPFARPSAAAGATAASMPAPSTAPAGMLPGGMPPLTGMPGMGGMPGMPDANVITEDVQASRVGTINGMRIYRGSNTYLFEKASEKKLVRNLVAQSPSSGDASGATHTGATGAAGGISPPTSLPSFVGKPAPKN